MLLARLRGWVGRVLPRASCNGVGPRQLLLLLPHCLTAPGNRPWAALRSRQLGSSSCSQGWIQGWILLSLNDRDSLLASTQPSLPPAPPAYLVHGAKAPLA